MNPQLRSVSTSEQNVVPLMPIAVTGIFFTLGYLIASGRTRLLREYGLKIGNELGQLIVASAYQSAERKTSRRASA